MILLYHYEGPKCPSDTLLTAAAADYTGRAPGGPALTILRLPGKPPTLPALPGHFFSVSHSGGRWMCAAGSVPLGLDLQIHQPCDAAKLSARFFHPDEDAWLRARGCHSADFFQLWSRKEAYVKYRGVGITQGLDWFSVVADGVLRERLGPVWFLQPEPPEGFSLCLCAERPEPVQLRPLCPTP